MASLHTARCRPTTSCQASWQQMKVAEFGLEETVAYMTGDRSKASEMTRKINSAVGLPAEWKPYTWMLGLITLRLSLHARRTWPIGCYAIDSTLLRLRVRLVFVIEPACFSTSLTA